MKNGISYSIDLENYLLSQEIMGKVALNELVSYNNKLMKFSDIDHINNVITDLRQLDLMHDIQKVTKTISLIFNNYSILKAKKHALVIDKIQQEFWSVYIIPIFKSLKINLTIKIFSQIEDAYNWLND